MPSYRSTPDFTHDSPESIGVLVVNLGTPEAPTAGAVRRFLKAFLSDPRVIEYPRALWWLILNLVILVIRPARSAAAYQKIWTKEGSPLLLHSQAIVKKLQAHFAEIPDRSIVVELAMTYGNPSIDDAINVLIQRGARRIVTLPLYPQYSGTTTAAAIDQVGTSFQSIRCVPEARFINSYHDEPAYIAALAGSVREHWRQQGRGDKLLMSFHGIPQSTLINGDPYHCQCQKTGRLLATELGLDTEGWTLSFQSRVGREKWLAPYTEDVVKQFAAEGTTRLDVICPGFSTDCLETLEEIELQNAEFFRSAGGKTLSYIPALNSRDDHIDLLAGLIDRHTLGWTTVNDEATLQETRRRAVAMGASL